MNKIRKIIGTYRSLSPQVKMSFWFLLCSFLQKGIGMLTTPVFTRVMLDSEFGRFNVYSTWSNIITVLATLSISGNCYTRGLVVHSEDRKRYTSSLQSLTTLLLTTAFILYLCFGDLIDSITHLNRYLMIVMFAEMLLISAYNFWINRKRVEVDYRSITALTIAYALLRPAVSVILVVKAPLQYQVEARVTATFIVTIILFLPILFSNLFKGKAFFSKEYWRESLIFCLPLIFHYLSNIILTQSDRLMIDRMCGASFTAYYSVAYSIGMIVQIFNNSVSTSLTPWIYKSIKEERYKQISTVSYQILVIIAILNIMIVSLGPEILKIMAPSNYHLALWAIPPVTASVYFMFMYDIFASFSFYYKKTSWISGATLASAILNIVLNYLFIPKFGFVAAGYTTLVCYVLFAILHYAFMNYVCKRMGITHKVYNGFYITAIGIALIMGCAIMMQLYPYPLIRIILLTCFAILAIVLRKRILLFIKKIRKI